MSKEETRSIDRSQRVTSVLTTTAYGANVNGRAGDRHENGHRATPLPVWGKEDTAGMSRASQRGISHLDIEGMTREFMRTNNGVKPVTLFTTSKFGTLVTFGKIYKGIGFVGLQIVYNQPEDKLC